MERKNMHGPSCHGVSLSHCFIAGIAAALLILCCGTSVDAEEYCCNCICSGGGQDEVSYAGDSCTEELCIFKCMEVCKKGWNDAQVAAQLDFSQWAPRDCEGYCEDRGTVVELASFTAEQKTKEIGVRKAMGASVPNVVFLLTKEFTKWVIIANIVAWPAAYFAMKEWLQNFAYPINISFWVFILSTVIALVIAFTTTSFQSVKAALANPVDSLRYE